MTRFQKYIAPGSLLCLLVLLGFSAVAYGATSLKNEAALKTQDQNSLGVFDKAKPGFLADKKAKYVSGEVIVKFKTGEISLSGQAGLSKAKNFAASKKLSLKGSVKKQNIVIFKINDSRSVESVVQELKKYPSVEFAQPNFIYYPTEISSNDTYKNLLWGMDNTGQIVNGTAGTAGADIDAPEAWAISEGTNTSTIVAVLDTGVAYNHPDLAANMWDGTNCKDENGDLLPGGCHHGYDYLAGDNDPLPIEESHGTHVAGTIAGIKGNGQGVIGVAPHAKIMAVKVGEEYLSDAAILNGIAFAEQNGAKVINASWGGGADNCADAYDEALYQAIQGFSGLFITAAGNSAANHDGSSYFGMPADYGSTASCWTGLDNIISVAATNSDDDLAYFSDYGANFIDVGAPGVDTYSTVAYYYSTLLNEDFEEAAVPNIPAGWTREGAVNNWRTASVSGSKVLYADQSFPYTDNATSSVTSPAYDLSSATEANMGFSVSCDTEYDLINWVDYLSLFFSSDGANFNRALRLDEVYIDMLNGEDPYSSTSAASMYFSAALPSGYLTNNFKVRFGWTSNGVDNNHDGCWIDNLNVSKITESLDGTNGGYDYMSGTSMATPHVVGLAALIWGDNPALTAAQVKSIILGSGDSLASLNGKTVTGKRINAYNSAFNVLNPAIGYESDNVIPTSSISQAVNGTGIVTVNFKVKDGIAGMAETLSNFGYSIDGGSTWKTPTSSDASAAFSGSWRNNGYTAAADYSSSSYSFTFNSKHSDFADFNNAQQNNVKIRFKANDGFKTSSYAESGVFAIDNLPPSVPVIIDPAEGINYVTTTSYTITGTADAGSLVRVYLADAISASQQLDSISTDYSIEVELEEGTLRVFDIRALDGFGNSASATGSVSIVRDGIPAALSMISVGGDSSAPYRTEESAPIIVFNATDTSPTLACRWDTVDTGYSAMSAENGFSASTAASSSSFTLPDQGEDGPKEVHVSCRDLAGNENSAGDNLDVAFTLGDTTKPVVASASASPDPAKAGTVTITVNFTDAGGMDNSVDPVVSVLGLHSVYSSTAKVSFASSTYIGTIDLQSDNEEVPGAVIKVVGAKDLGGNTMTDNNNAGSFVVDTIAPRFSAVSAGGDLSAPYYTKELFPVIVFSATDTSPTLACRWDTVDTGYSAMSAENGFSASTAASSSSFTLPDQGEDGPKEVHVSCRDLAGNENSAGDNLDVAFVLDTVAPTAVLSNKPSSGTTATTADVIVGGESVAFYKYKLGGGSYSSSFATSTHISLSGLSVGPHTLYVVGSDEAGNWQSSDVASSTNHTWTVASSGGGSSGSGSGASDTTAPTISNIVATPTSGTTATITWKTNESSLSWLNYGTSTAYSLQVKTSSYLSTHSVNLAGLNASTTYHYQVKSQDFSGNSGTAGDKTFTTLAAGTVAPTSTAATATTSTSSSTSTSISSINPNVSQMTREQLIAFILQLIAAMQTSGTTGTTGTTTGGATGTGTGTGTGSTTGLSAVPATFTFQTNLKFGMTLIDVKYLQIVLNSSADTKVALTGVGSSGYETTKFGNATLAAVKNFQTKYGIVGSTSAAYGLVGPVTRVKLNSLLGR